MMNTFWSTVVIAIAALAFGCWQESAYFAVGFFALAIWFRWGS